MGRGFGDGEESGSRLESSRGQVEVEGDECRDIEG
jgi:hypothetical protein